MGLIALFVQYVGQQCRAPSRPPKTDYLPRVRPDSPHMYQPAATTSHKIAVPEQPHPTPEKNPL
jgi:hypothetical protein